MSLKDTLLAIVVSVVVAGSIFAIYSSVSDSTSSDTVTTKLTVQPEIVQELDGETFAGSDYKGTLYVSSDFDSTFDMSTGTIQTASFNDVSGVITLAAGALNLNADEAIGIQVIDHKALNKMVANGQMTSLEAEDFDTGVFVPSAINYNAGSDGVSKALKSFSVSDTKNSGVAIVHLESERVTNPVPGIFKEKSEQALSDVAGFTVTTDAIMTIMTQKAIGWL